MKALVILDHNFSHLLVIWEKWTFVDPYVAFWSIFMRTPPPLA